MHDKTFELKPVETLTPEERRADRWVELPAPSHNREKARRVRQDERARAKKAVPA